VISVQDHSQSYYTSSTIWDDPLALVFVNMNVKVVVCDCGKAYKMSPEMARKFYENRKFSGSSSPNIIIDRNIKINQENGRF